MDQKNWLILDKDFIEYCELNKIENIVEYAKEVFKKGFMLVKYGNQPIVVDPDLVIHSEPVMIKENGMRPPPPERPKIETKGSSPLPITKKDDLYSE